MKIDAIIVTFNRLNKLKNALDAFEKQEYLPNRMIIVNNHSSDGTSEYLHKWKEKNASKFEVILIELNENIGGAGGFATGMQYALDNGAEWIWVSDDDAYPKKDALKIANEFLEKNKKENISAICGTVLKNGKKIDLGHRRYVKEGILKLKEIDSKREDYQKDHFEVNLFTYVATIINVEKMKQVGIADKEFFIYYDDSDHAARLNKVGKIICVPKIQANHDVDEIARTTDYTWKTYYLLRNKLFFLKRNFKHRYAEFEVILVWLRILKKRNKGCTKLILDAIKDFKSDKLGKRCEYVPGVNIYKLK